MERPGFRASRWSSLAFGELTLRLGIQSIDFFWKWEGGQNANPASHQHKTHHLPTKTIVKKIYLAVQLISKAIPTPDIVLMFLHTLAMIRPHKKKHRIALVSTRCSLPCWIYSTPHGKNYPQAMRHDENWRRRIQKIIQHEEITNDFIFHGVHMRQTIMAISTNKAVLQDH